MTRQNNRSSPQQRRIVVLSTLIGATVEWYDFFIFGTLSALFLNKLFFPSFDAKTGTLLSFMTCATGWLARPIRGVIAGHISDRIGRKATLYWSFLIMGVASTPIGCLPTYENVGEFGAIALVALRVIQGLSVGAEFGGSVVALVEHADPSRRGIFGTISQMGTLVGLLLGNMTFFIVANLDQAALMAWGWRVPFLLSAVMLVIGMYIRAKMQRIPRFC